MRIFSDSQFHYTSEHNQFDTCIVTRVLILFICRDPLKVLRAFLPDNKA